MTVPRSLVVEPWRTCHCGRPAAWHDWDDPWTRGLCNDCDSVRCDAYPQECPHPTTRPAHHRPAASTEESTK